MTQTLIAHAAVILAAVFAAVHGGVAHAVAFRVVIEQTSAVSKACGISEASLEAVARRTLAGSQWPLDGAAGGKLSVHITAAQSWRVRCLARVSVRMQASTKPLHSDGPDNSKAGSPVPTVVLCDKTAMFSLAKARSSVVVESAVEYSIRDCLRSLEH